jgi:hypothetical protein
MKRSVLEQKLNDAMQRRSRAQNEEWYLTDKIKYHDSEATSIRKDRQKQRAKKDRAEAAIARLNQQLQETS